ncbi:MAG: hypothetical protein OXI87_23750 [Albidovulum sp.]|nr:hypothetical protein [Albidovulum sp.]MDE0307871.1 hypothetical protein [Albidovulum sp.]
MDRPSVEIDRLVSVPERPLDAGETIAGRHVLVPYEDARLAWRCGQLLRLAQ